MDSFAVAHSLERPAEPKLNQLFTAEGQLIDVNERHLRTQLDGAGNGRHCQVSAVLKFAKVGYGNKPCVSLLLRLWGFEIRSPQTPHSKALSTLNPFPVNSLTLSRISYKAYNLFTFSTHGTHQNYS